MANRFTTSMARLRDRLRENAGVSITYTVLATGYVLGPIDVVVGKSDFLIDGADGAAVNFTSRDYLIGADVFVDADGNPLTPARGDTIVEGNYTYTVMIENSTSPPWKWSDSTRTLLRIHTKQTAVAQ